MKKLMLIVAFAGVASFAFAQKPSAGDKTAEVGLNLQTGTAPISYTVPELRFRYFTSDDMAYRLRVNLGSSSNTDAYDFGTYKWEAKTGSGFGIGLAGGVEKHMKGTSKLSPYMGAELGISFGTGATATTTNGSSSVIGGAGNGNKYEFKGGSSFGLGLGLVMGADYYVADGIYVGVEYGLGIFNMTSTGEGEETVNGGAAVKTATNKTFDLFGVGGGGVRLGYKF